MDQQNQTFQECLSLYCITSFFLHFWIRKLQKTKNSVKTKHHHLQKKSSNCYQCISGFKYCSSPEISSSILGIQDQGGGSLWSLFLGIVLEVEAKVKEGGGSTGHWWSNQVEEGCSGSLTVLDKTLITDCQCQAEGIFSSVSWVH